MKGYLKQDGTPTPDKPVKIEVKLPLIEDKELENFDNYIHEIVEEYSKMYFKEKDQVLTQRIIMKQEEEIGRLNARVKECEEAYLRTRHQYSELEGKYVINDHIINELEKYIHNELVLDFYDDDMPCELIINKMENMIKKLKGDSSND